MGPVNDDEMQRMHARISNLSLGLIVLSLAIISLTCGVFFLNLEEIIHAWGRIF